MAQLIMVSRLIRLGAYRSGLWPIPKVVIVAPDYTHLSSGTRCLHILCARLNRLGISAAVTARRRNANFDTPRIHAKAIAGTSLLDQAIVIYPEVIAGNPLGARNVVRYLLNKPGFFTGAGVETYGANDYYLHFAEEFRPPGLTSRLLHLPLIDTTVFTPDPPVTRRQGFLVYSVRRRPPLESFPAWVEPRIVISRENPRGPAELAALYRSSRALIVCERTAATVEALNCHCPIIGLSHPDFDPTSLVRFVDGCGVTIGFDPEGLVRAAASAKTFPAAYAARIQNLDAEILDFVDDATRYFQLTGLRRAVG